MSLPLLSLRRLGRRAALTLVVLVSFLGVTLASLVGTDANDFAQPGTQPNDLTDGIAPSGACFFCHAQYDDEEAPYDRWSGTMMANSTRDPIFHAALAIAEQDAGESGEFCIRCHAPGGWLEGRSTPTDGSALFEKDFDGVTCHICHRMVDPVADIENPAEDTSILAALTSAPTDPSHNGQFVIDPLDRRRGPFEPDVCQSYHEARQSPFHQESLMCATCHEVSNPVFSRVGGATPAPGDTYVPNANATEHPTHVRYDQFPVERTYSEWLNSDFGQGPVEMGGLFGGNKTAVSSCQDCHMPDITGSGCAPGFGAPVRPDLPQHDFAGANSWVPLSVYNLDQTLALYTAAEASNVPQYLFQSAVDRNVSMLERASDLTLSNAGDTLTVRLTNNSGHKLPTGYPEGRRMWINVRFYDAQGMLIDESGAYDNATATLTEAGAKVYECKIGPDEAFAPTAGLPAEPSFHFVLNNKVYKDNRIPPRGFTNANFEAIQAAPVGATYADGQYWDDTDYAIPCDAVTAEVTVFHQTTTKEYIEFLRDNNTTNNTGQIAYDEWVLHGKSAPVVMDQETLDLGPRLAGDVTEISVSAGGTQSLCVNAGPAYAGKLYWILGSLTGSVPGVPVGSVHVPLNPDAYFQYTILNPNLPPLTGSFGTLDANGQASAAFTLAPGSNPVLIGGDVDHAYGVIDLGAAIDVSNAQGLDFLP